MTRARRAPASSLYRVWETAPRKPRRFARRITTLRFGCDLAPQGVPATLISCGATLRFRAGKHFAVSDGECVIERLLTPAKSGPSILKVRCQTRVDSLVIGFMLRLSLEPRFPRVSFAPAAFSSGFLRCSHAKPCELRTPRCFLRRNRTAAFPCRNRRRVLASRDAVREQPLL